VGGDIVGRGQAGGPGSDGASPYPSFALPAPKASRVKPVKLPYKLALMRLKPWAESSSPFWGKISRCELLQMSKL
jgi:hypothetical protein